MRVLDIIRAKRDGKKLSAEEIKFFVDGYTRGEIPDYQASAWLMAVYFRGMDREETQALTDAMASSGARLDWSGEKRRVVDKHSTGGVGDKTTLVLMPLVAAAGAAVGKMSGRGLGHTGGTVDKLSCIPGFQTDLTTEQFARQLRELGLVVTGQSPDLAPADGKLYALRDVTATVDSIPLIAASVMSKKIASGAQGIVLDVKTGSGAFMRSREQARELAAVMVDIGRGLGRNTVALLTNMEQPLGRAVGNHLEVLEAIETLKGNGPADLVELCLSLGAEMLAVAGLEEDREAARAILSELLADGRALAMMERWIKAQGGDANVVANPELLGSSRHRLLLRAEQEGYLARVDALTVGECSVLLGAGREKKGDPVDLWAGILLHKKVGDFVRRGEILAELFSSDEKRLEKAAKHLAQAYGFVDRAPAPMPVVLERLDGTG